MSRSQYLIDALRSIGQPQDQTPGGGQSQGVGFQMLGDRLAQLHQPQDMKLPTPGMNQTPVDPTQVLQKRPMTGGLPGLARMFLGR